MAVGAEKSFGGDIRAVVNAAVVGDDGADINVDKTQGPVNSHFWEGTTRKDRIRDRTSGHS